MNGGPAAWGGWGRTLDSWALGSMAMGLAVLMVALLLIPQRLAQRPARQGVVSLRMARDGQLWLWNQPIQPAQLLPALRSFEAAAARPTVRLIPDADVPWGVVQQLVERLGPTDLPLELLLP